jgi:hemoglobin
LGDESLAVKCKGDPLKAHVKVDEHFGGKIGPNEFGIWLNYWAQTLDELLKAKMLTF